MNISVESWCALLGENVRSVVSEAGELTLIVPRAHLLQVMQKLQTHPELQFQQLIDLCGVDYSTYGLSEWETVSATNTGFDRAVLPLQEAEQDTPNEASTRFAVVYHLLSLTLNQRVRVRTFANDVVPRVDSVCNLFPNAEWYEREAFDLYGILFNHHPDLRRILTDYGFIGHPFRKDFPLIGEVEVRYDAAEARVLYESVSITPRTLVPRVIRSDNRYAGKQEDSTHG